MRERTLAWEGCLNVRDLGGHPTEDGGETLWGRVIRADSVHSLTDKGGKPSPRMALRRSSICARTANGPTIRGASSSWRSSTSRCLPRRAILSTGRSTRWRRRPSTAPTRPVVFYLEVLRRWNERFAAAIAAVAAAPSGAVVVHCAVGKDRTGLDQRAPASRSPGCRSAISRTTTRSARRTSSRAGGPGSTTPQNEPEREHRLRMVASPAGSMLGVLARLEAEHGSIAEFLRSAGLDEAIARLCPRSPPWLTSSRSSARRRRARPRLPKRSLRGCRRRSSPPTRCRSTAACLSSRTSRSGPRASSRSGRSPHEASLGEYQALAHAAIDEIAGDRPHSDRRRRHGALPPRGARRARAAARAVAGLRGSAGARSTTSAGERRRTPSWLRSIPRRQPLVHPNDRRRVVRALELAEAGASLRPAHDRLWTNEMRHPTLDRRPRRGEGDARAADRRADGGDVRGRGGGRSSRTRCRRSSRRPRGR